MDAVQWNVSSEAWHSALSWAERGIYSCVKLSLVSLDTRLSLQNIFFLTSAMLSLPSLCYQTVIKSKSGAGELLLQLLVVPGE